MNEQWAVVNLSQMPYRFTYWHQTERAAREEAERLARQVPAARFVVLRAVAVVRVPETPVAWESCEPVPF